MDDSSIYDLPQEFLADIADASGYCDAQSVLPRGDHYICHCTCGFWDVTAPTRDEGLRLARLHTDETGA